MLWGPLPSEGISNSVTKPVVVIRPILLPTTQRGPGWRMQADSVNHKAPSGPVVMPQGWAFGLGRANSVILPSVEIRPIFPLSDWVNHSAPSGPVVIPPGPLFSVGIANSVTAPRSRSPPDLATSICEPQCAVWSSRDLSTLCRGNRELGEHAGSRDPPDLAAGSFGEPQGTVWPGRDAKRSR